jgi:hypothetical protein
MYLWDSHASCAERFVGEYLTGVDFGRYDRRLGFARKGGNTQKPLFACFESDRYVYVFAHVGPIGHIAMRHIDDERRPGPKGGYLLSQSLNVELG